ncbi:O-antigen polymerase [Solidesulfovibrio carbinoliphilus subsp. oakridgensis]|uniref:O-antigen polymerase n=1 Tax=Solidesulfovibrio carbinoliphilus subsp. oakridgensis TaxID=694327 RepID=G7Q8N6_9BACT|nr:O-antigen ligase family protein [Solidesulfovibrio carbinoliphilus]EHJ49123.1 O-antigen polymerase [Solidesulfovibrio carbinoliphilus subsp. oakridgensis]
MQSLSRALKVGIALAAVCFFSASLVVVCAVLLQGGMLHRLFLAGGAGCLVLGLWRPRCLPALLGAFGCSLVFFGFQNYMLPTRLLEYETLCLTILLCIRQRHRVLRAPRSVMEWCFWLLPAMAATSVLVPLGPDLWATYKAAGVLGLARWMTGTPAADAYYAVGAAWRLVLFASLGWALANGEEKAFRPLVRGIALGTLFSVVVGLAAYVLSSGAALSMDGRLASLFFNPGWYAEYLCMTYPLVILLLQRSNLSKSVYVFIALSAIVVTLTMARAAWIIFLYLVLQTVFLLFKSHRVENAGGTPYLKGVAVCFSIVLCSALLAYHYLAVGQKTSKDVVLTEKITDRLVHFTDTPRLTVFTGGVLIGLESPLVGYGYESYAWRYRQLMQDPESRLARAMPKDAEAFEATHNFFIQLFSGIGLLGVLVWTVLIGCAFRAWRFWAARGDGLARAALASAIVFHLFGLFQEMTYVPPVWLLMFLLLGHGLAADNRLPGREGRGAGVRRGAAAVALWLVFALVTGLRQEPHPGARAEARGLFAAERIDGKERSWSAGTAALVLDGAGPWEIEVGVPGPLVSGKAATVSLRNAAGKTLDVLVFRPGEATCGRFRLEPGDAAPGQRIYIQADRLYFPPVLQMADQRVLGPFVRIESQP